MPAAVSPSPASLPVAVAWFPSAWLLALVAAADLAGLVGAYLTGLWSFPPVAWLLLCGPVVGFAALGAGSAARVARHAPLGARAIAFAGRTGLGVVAGVLVQAAALALAFATYLLALGL